MLLCIYDYELQAWYGAIAETNTHSAPAKTSASRRYESSHKISTCSNSLRSAWLDTLVIA